MQRRTPVQSILDELNARFFKKSPEEGVPLYGHIDFDLKHADGTHEYRSMKNLIMDAGEDEAAKLLVGLVASPFTYIALGTDDDPAPADSQTALNAECTTTGAGRAEDASPTTSGNVSTISVTFSFTGNHALVEVGLFNDTYANGGDMFSRQIFAVINVKDTDQMTVTWSITHGTSRA
jgi:hypothetical protein